MSRLGSLADVAARDLRYVRRGCSGGLAIFGVATRLASFGISSCTADPPPGRSRNKLRVRLSVVITHDKTGRHGAKGRDTDAVPLLYLCGRTMKLT
jgi:hypothetical protein